MNGYPSFYSRIALVEPSPGGTNCFVIFDYFLLLRLHKMQIPWLFPDFSQYPFFPWPSTKFPDFSQVWNFPDFSLTDGHPVGVTVRKRSIGDKIGNFLSRVILKFEGWPWKTLGHLFYVALSFVHHFTAISELKLELQSGNAQFGSNSTIFRAVGPWNLTDDPAKQ